VTPKPKAAVLRVEAALAEAGIASQVLHTPATARTAEDAAKAIGTSVGAIVKSLVFACDGRPVLALVSGTNRLDTDALGRLAGGAIERADAKSVRDATGYAIGGIPPLGHPEQLPTWIDEDLLGYDVIWAAAGTPKAVFRTEPVALQRATQAAVIQVT
jgi:prolyl-tRNA editing enzyme YbaK/EbsC (Cys-tRNA(Pro) deacylase)